MATGTNGIANVQDIKTKCNITLSSESALCPNYTTIIANTGLTVNGSYESYQLVLYSDISKKESNVTLTFSNLKAYFDATYGEVDTRWYLYEDFNERSLDGGIYPTSNINYFDGSYTNTIVGTPSQWLEVYNASNMGSDLCLTNYDGDVIRLDGTTTTGVASFLNTLKNGSSVAVNLTIPTPQVSYATANLNGEWKVSSSNPNTGAYYAFESAKNTGVSPSYDRLTLVLSGSSSYTFYIRSNGESNWDYVMVSKPNVSITSATTYNSTYVLAHTRGASTSSTGVTAYTTVNVTGLTANASSVITIIYRKDTSGDDGTDKGYVLLPKENCTYSNPYTGGTTGTTLVEFSVRSGALLTGSETNGSRINLSTSTLLPQTGLQYVELYDPNTSSSNLITEIPIRQISTQKLYFNPNDLKPYAGNDQYIVIDCKPTSTNNGLFRIAYPVHILSDGSIQFNDADGFVFIPGALGTLKSSFTGTTQVTFENVTTSMYNGGTLYLSNSSYGYGAPFKLNNSSVSQWTIACKGTNTNTTSYSWTAQNGDKISIVPSSMTTVEQYYNYINTQPTITFSKRS